MAEDELRQQNEELSYADDALERRVAECTEDLRTSNEHLKQKITELERADIFLFSQVSDLPEEATRDKAYLGRLGPKSAVAIPLVVAGSVTGAVSFASLGKERPWSDGVIQRLRLVGEIFSNALGRKQADESLHKAFAEIETLQEQLQAENLYLRKEIKGEHNFEQIIGQSDILKSVLFRVEQVARSDATVLPDFLNTWGSVLPAFLNEHWWLTPAAVLPVLLFSALSSHFWLPALARANSDEIGIKKSIDRAFKRRNLIIVSAWVIVIVGIAMGIYVRWIE